MPTEPLNIPIETTQKNQNAWRELLKNIRETKSELVKLQDEGKRGSTEWVNYTSKLKDLSREKKVVQREAEITGQRLLAMSRDLTVLNFGIRQTIQDIKNFNIQGKNFEDTVQNATNSTLQLTTGMLTLAPAVKSLSIELGLTATAVAGVAAALAGMYVFVTKFPKAFDDSWRAVRFFKGEITFDEGVAEFERLNNAIDNVRLSLAMLSKSRWNVFGNAPYQDYNVPTKEQRTPQQLIDAYLYEEPKDAVKKLSTKTDKSPLTPLKEDILDISKKIPDLETINKLVQSLGITPKTGRSGQPVAGKGSEKVIEQVIPIYDIIARIPDAFSPIVSDAQNIANILGIGADTFISKLLSGLQSALSLTSSVISIISSIAKLASGGFLKFLGFAEGGYTGEGGKHEPAGLVHKGEFVFSKEETDKFRPLFEMLHSNKISRSNGYSDGGYVTPMSSSGTTNLHMEFSGAYADDSFVNRVVRLTPNINLKITKKK